MTKSKRLLFKRKRPFRKRLSPIRSGDQINYANTDLLTDFISEQGKILSRKVTRLTLKQQRLITIAIKKARILSFLPFITNRKKLERRTKSTTRTDKFRKKNKKFQRIKSTPRTDNLNLRTKNKQTENIRPENKKLERIQSTPRTDNLNLRPENKKFQRIKSTPRTDNFRKKK